MKKHYSKPVVKKHGLLKDISAAPESAFGLKLK
jgi:hypothetical protein